MQRCALYGNKNDYMIQITLLVVNLKTLNSDTKKEHILSYKNTNGRSLYVAGCCL